MPLGSSPPRQAQATRAITPWTPRGLPVRRCEKKRLRVAGRAEVEPLDLVRLPPPGVRVPPTSRGRAGARPRHRRRRHARTAPPPQARPRSSTARLQGRCRRERRHRVRRPHVRRRPRADLASRRGATATAGMSPFERTSAIGRQSAAKARIGRSGSSVQSPSPGSPRTPAAARCTSVEWIWRLIASRSGAQPTSAQSRRRFSSTRSTSSPVSRPRLSEANGPSLTPPSRVAKTTSYGPATFPANHAQRVRRAC